MHAPSKLLDHRNAKIYLPCCFFSFIYAWLEYELKTLLKSNQQSLNSPEYWETRRPAAASRVLVLRSSREVSPNQYLGLPPADGEPMLLAANVAVALFSS